ncbi:MAG TPA: phospholipase D-like domain-containing protein [Streptosporangiaceae bacterium]
MPVILDPAALVDRYFALSNDTGGKFAKGEAPPEQQSADAQRGNRVEAFIDGLAFFEAIDDELDAVLASTKPGRYFYLTAWWLGLTAVTRTVQVQSVGDALKAVLEKFPEIQTTWTIDLDTDEFKLPKSGRTLLVRLQELSARGVDVRVLAWSSPFAPKWKAVADRSEGVADLNLQTLVSIDELRKTSSSTANRMVVNLLAHPFGGAHLKLIVCGDSDSMRAYTSGMDPVANRLNAVPSLHNGRTSGWHDVGVRFQGPAALASYHFYQQLWNEQISRSADTFYVDGGQIPSQVSSTTPIPDRKPAGLTSNATQRVQVLRTMPQMNFSIAGPKVLHDNPVLRFLMSSYAGFKQPPAKFAPDGIFEFKVALKKAIANAQRYVFIVDQALSAMEVMDWLNARMKQEPKLKVILLHGADPADPPSDDLAEAVNKHLLPGLSIDPYDKQPEQVVCYGWSGVAAHAKVTIVDDLWCAVGSANCMRRSLYTDIELSIAVIDSEVPTFPQRLRRDLWARYCGLPLANEDVLGYAKERDALLDLDSALGIWRWGWGWRPNGVQLHPTITPYRLPMKSAPFSQEGYDLRDPDSRQTF